MVHKEGVRELYAAVRDCLGIGEGPVGAGHRQLLHQDGGELEEEEQEGKKEESPLERSLPREGTISAAEVSHDGTNEKSSGESQTDVNPNRGGGVGRGYGGGEDSGKQGHQNQEKAGGTASFVSKCLKVSYFDWFGIF